MFGGNVPPTNNDGDVGGYAPGTDQNSELERRNRLKKQNQDIIITVVNFVTECLN